MNTLYSILDLMIVVVISVGVAVLVISLGKWKIKMGLLPRFKESYYAEPSPSGMVFLSTASVLLVKTVDALLSFGH
jgi:hypothetical protein